MTYVLRIKKEDIMHSSMKDILEDFPKDFLFRNEAYMVGFLDGRLYKKYRLQRLEEFENSFNGLYNGNIQDVYFIKFLYTSEED